MRCEKQYFLKCLLIVLLVVMVAFLFQPGPANAQKGSIAQVLKITTEISSGLYTATLETPYGKINVNLPDDIAFGDIVAGTLYTSPLGKTKEEIAKNLDKLNSYVVEIEEIKDKRTPAAQKKDSWIIPKGIDAIHLVFKDKDNVQMARKEVPLSPKPLAYSPADFHLPTIGQAQELLHITGPFDGDFSSTTIRIGDIDAELLAESPRGLIVLTPPDVIGPTKITLKEGDFEVDGEYRNVSVRLAAGKNLLIKGESTEVTVIVRGLEGLEEEIPIRLQNKSPGTINMAGGNIQAGNIRPKDIKPGGIYTYTRTVTGIMPGMFHINVRIYPQLNPGDEDFSQLLLQENISDAIHPGAEDIAQQGDEVDKQDEGDIGDKVDKEDKLLKCNVWISMSVGRRILVEDCKKISPGEIKKLAKKLWAAIDSGTKAICKSLDCPIVVIRNIRLSSSSCKNRVFVVTVIFEFMCLR